MAIIPPQKEWKNTSPSQIKTHRSCPRKWWFEKIAGWRRPSGDAADLGTRKHAVLEKYFRQEAPLTDPMLLPGLPYLPSPLEISPQGVELRINFRAEDIPVPIKGIIDLVDHRNGRIIDHKTTSNFTYALAEEELPHDPQAIMYSRFALAFITEFQALDSITFRLVYYRTRGSYASIMREVTFTRERLRAQWASIVESSNQMLAHAKLPAEEVPYKLTACSAYGGCPYQVQCARCGADTLGSLGALFSAAPSTPSTQPRDTIQMNAPTNTTNAFRDRVASRQQQQELPTPPPAAPSPYHGWFGANGYTQPPESFEGHEAALAWGKAHFPDDGEERTAYKQCYEKIASTLGRQPHMGELSLAWIQAVRDRLIDQKQKQSAAAPVAPPSAPVLPPVPPPPSAGINPPDGNGPTDTPTDDETPPSTTESITTDGKPPWFPDGSSARTYRKPDLFAKVGELFKALSPAQQTAFKGAIPEENREWYDAGCPEDRTKRIDVINLHVAPLTCLSTNGALHEEHISLLEMVAAQGEGEPTQEQQEPQDGDTEFPETAAPPLLADIIKPEKVNEWIEANRDNPRITSDVMDAVMSLSYDQEDDTAAATVINLALSNIVLQSSAAVAATPSPLLADLQGLREENASLLAALEKADEEADRLHAEKEAMMDAGGALRKTLYINCRPTAPGQQVQDFNRWIVPYQDRAAQAAKQPHWLLIEFNKGPAYVAAAVDKAIEQDRGLLPDAMYIDRNSKSAEIVVDVLAKHYDNVISG